MEPLVVPFFWLTLLGLHPVDATWKKEVSQLSSSPKSRVISLSEAQNALWDGRNVITVSNVTDIAEEFGIPFVHDIHKAPKINIQTMGMFDSGTNLLDMYLKKNFNRKHSHEFWKHFPPVERQNVGGLAEKWVDKHLQDRNAYVIIMVRNPISHIVSWRKDGYNIDLCAYQKWDKILSEPCHMQWRFRKDKSIKWEVDFEAPGLVSVWNDYIQGYVKLLKKYPEKVLICRYEDLVIHPELEIARMAKFMNVPLPEKITTIVDAAKNVHHSGGRDLAIEKITKSKYIEEITYREPSGVPIRKVLDKICPAIDFNLIKHLPLGEEDVPRYDSDCKKYIS
eukprot:CAMPEP_0185251934 /NCGR_PEP_ID=MMETSP1359-20130426/1214_1 /TAXON_ID=552665 /ORGANISM="Bigelowiella longifila, Strain CCMP242" /LENGTH=336 /DNA_ID=CAMNT_0027833999 /DNA_START=6 /DNA_END=1016 /DNA_ORIENTATION=-